MSEALQRKRVTQTIEEAKAEVLEHMRKKREAKAKKEAERAAWWKEYREQLAKSMPNQGGATHKSHRSIRAWKVM